MIQREDTAYADARPVTRMRRRAPDDTLRYISDMSGQLAALAGAARLPMLTYFLNMARVEAEMQIYQRGAPPQRR